MKLCGSHQLLVYADDVKILGRSIHTIRKNTVALVFANKETGLEVNVEKTWVHGHISRKECRTRSKYKDIQ